ncbi:MAG TPA: PQQ-dependent sugar dehydrogenase, partial [Myxococcota bacterium]
MLRNHRVLAVAVLALAASTLAVGAGACTSCNPPATASEGEGSPGEGEGSPGEGEGEGSPGEGEGEGPVDAGVVDAGPLDPDAVGLDSRPANTTCHAPARPAPTGALDTVTPWPNLQVRSPVLMLQEPGTNNMVVVERGGTLVRFDKDNAAVTIPDLFADFTNLVNTTDNGSDERGLLGLAFHPDWPDVPEIYVSYSGTGGNTGLTDNVSRFTLGSDGTIDEHTEQKLISFSDPASNHNGGMIAFSPTDPCRTCLYSGVGDGGGGDGQFGTSQDTSVLLSKMIRIDVDGTTSAADAANDPCATPGVGLNYGIPADNPFVGNSAFCPEIYAYGLRNPWRWSFDRESGDQWVGDVGQNQHEEVDQLVAGGNYGWNVFEGFACHSADNTTDP